MKRKFIAIALGALLGAIFATGSAAQARRISCEEYIATYAPLAIQLQKEYKIPASIKIAQGIFESDSGNSDLARRSNNHFGIKCKSEWQGPSVLHDDDAAGECFRKYATIEESYLDHAKFLAERPYYTSLFKLDIYDYRGWAKGLQAAGYATAKHYADAIINIIDRYELYLLDDGEYPACIASVKPVTFLNLTAQEESLPQDTEARILQGTDPDMAVSVFKAGGHGIYVRNGVRCIIVREGESYESIAKSLRIPVRRLMRFNGDPSGGPLAAGQILYIENGGKIS